MSKKQLEKIDVKCDVCEQWHIIVRGSYEQNIKRNGFYRCSKCSPQRNKEFWKDPVKKLAHSNSVKSSTAYYESLPARSKKLSGENNGMFGRSHKIETIQKMSKSRTGKIGKKATAWKGGKTSFTQRIKGFIQTRYSWFTNILKRDNLTCCWCGNTHNLDAHHIEPVVNIIKRITENVLFENEDLKIEFVIKHPDIEDTKLINGITLCRPCHKRAHKNWGSHVRP